MTITIALREYSQEPDSIDFEHGIDLDGGAGNRGNADGRASVAAIHHHRQQLEVRQSSIISSSAHCIEQLRQRLDVVQPFSLTRGAAA